MSDIQTILTRITEKMDSMSFITTPQCQAFDGWTEHHIERISKDGYSRWVLYILEEMEKLTTDRDSLQVLEETRRMVDLWGDRPSSHNFSLSSELDGDRAEGFVIIDGVSIQLD